MRNILSTLIAIFISNAALAQEIDISLGCKTNPQLVGACFSTRGRLAVYNGTPSLRITITKSHRLLGIIEDEALHSIPINIRDQINREHEINGNFIVCPLTEEKPNHMQLVCVDTASNIRVRQHR